MCILSPRTDGAISTSPGFLGWLARASGAYQIIHVHGVFNGFCSLAATVALGQHRPVVLTPCGMLSRYSFTNRRRRLKRLFHRIVDAPNLRRISAVQFESEGEREEAEELGLVSPERGWVIPPPLAPVTITRRWGPGTGRVLFLSRLDPKKNVELLIDAWPVVLQSIPHAQLTIAGHGDPGYSRTLQSRARNLGAPSASISFAGFVASRRNSFSWVRRTSSFFRLVTRTSGWLPWRRWQPACPSWSATMSSWLHSSRRIS
jgi:glycosyltransferase involved in cell wall biosynthesis